MTEFSIYIIIYGVLTAVNVFCAIKLYPGFKDIFNETTKDGD